MFSPRGGHELGYTPVSAGVLLPLCLSYSLASEINPPSKSTAASSASSPFWLDSEPNLTTQLSQTSSLYKVSTRRGGPSSLTACSGEKTAESFISNKLFSTIHIEGHLENGDSTSYKIRRNILFLL